MAPGFQTSVAMDLDASFATQEHPVIQTTEVDLTNSQHHDQIKTQPSVKTQEVSPTIPQFDGSLSDVSFNGFASFTKPSVQSNVSVVVPAYHPKYGKLPYATGRSGLVYDVRMRFHLDPTEGSEAHPERPRRILEIFEALCDAGLAVDPGDNNCLEDDPANEYKLARIQIRQATTEEIVLIHSPEHVAFVQGLGARTKEDLAFLTSKGDSIYFHPMSWLSASLAAGGAIEATRAVVSGGVRNAVAIIRPPGHHAEHGAPSGFCFFNNVCIATRVVQREFPETCRKVLIMDWDVHHGNGIQQAFESDPNVLYISTHVYKNGNFYPNTNYGDHLHCGLEEGIGRNVNIPWMEQGMTDADYILAFQQVVMPIAAEFDPDLVIIAAGFDAAEGDELGGCHVSPAGYAHMTHMLMQLAKGKMVACLEGGYNLKSIANSAVAMTKVMMGEAPDRLGELSPTPSAVVTVQKVIRTQAAFWKCMYPKNFQLGKRSDANSDRLHDVIRAWQSQNLWAQYGMSELFVLQEDLSRSFKNQVLATNNYNEARPLLVIFHDPPEAFGYPDARTSKLELHNTFIVDDLPPPDLSASLTFPPQTDASKKYIDWAVKHHFAVIDVNIPKHISGIHPTEANSASTIENDPEKLRADAAKRVASYLWTNYIELSYNTHIFLLGIGDAYSGLLDLLSNHPSASEDVTLTACFIANHALRSVQSPSDDAVARRFHDRSLIFVSPSHAAFDPLKQKKLKRRYGNVVKSTDIDLISMLDVHFDQVTTRFLKEIDGWEDTEVGTGTGTGESEEDADGPRVVVTGTEGSLGDVDMEDELANGVVG